MGALLAAQKQFQTNSREVEAVELESLAIW